MSSDCDVTSANVDLGTEVTLGSSEMGCPKV